MGTLMVSTQYPLRKFILGYFYLLYAGRPETITVSRGGSAGEGYIPRNEVLGYVP
jgi:hypothetical protein